MASGFYPRNKSVQQFNFNAQDWLRGPMCPSTARLDGKLAVVTGSNTGIGRETAKGLAARGARVVLACRNMKQAQEVASEIESAGGKADVMELDLQSFASVRRFAAALAARFPKLDILVNNAGVAFQPKQMTEDGEEQVMQVNHLSPFLLTNLLLDMLNTAGKARVVNLSSLMHTWAKDGIQWDDLKWEKKTFDSWSAYAQSKLANIYFTRELARRQGSKSGLTVYAVHPGAVDSDLGRSYRDKIPAFVRKYLTDFVKVFLKTSEHGAQTSIYCAVEQTLEKETGKYYADCMRCRLYFIFKSINLSELQYCLGIILLHCVEIFFQDCPCRLRLGRQAGQEAMGGND